jgi:mono/diheme cytochrome c family protein
MKKIFSIAALTMLVWGCAKKITPAASSNGSAASGSTAPSPATLPVPPAAKTATAPVNTTPVSPIGTGSKTSAASADPAKPASPEMMGQATFNTKCGRCHGLKVTTDYTAERWISIMQVMAIKAKLTDGEKENVLAYVKANAKK